MASFTRDWDEGNPTDETYAYEIDEYNRYLRVDCSDRLKVMIYGFTAGENDGLPGLKKATFKQQTSAPSTPNTDEIEIYALDDGTACGLSAKNENGYTKQILKKSGTSLILNCEAGDYTANSIDEDDIQLANDGYLTALDAAGTGTVDLIKAGTNDLPTLPDSSEMASNAAPTEDEGIANKKYVDDNIASEVTASAYTTEDSDANTMLKSHAYKAATDGWVFAYDTGLDNGNSLKVYVGSTDDPVGAGDLIQQFDSFHTDQAMSVCAFVAENEYFEVTSDKTPTIRWKSVGTLSKPVDQD
ncbi:MAG: hypothetical protein HWN68_10030 [Desulfobacterales bacterium]|nr:hypothetical protein [Desulfobacterales bacterium]